MINKYFISENEKDFLNFVFAHNGEFVSNNLDIVVTKTRDKKARKNKHEFHILGNSHLLICSEEKYWEAYNKYRFKKPRKKYSSKDKRVKDKDYEDCSKLLSQITRDAERLVYATGNDAGEYVKLPKDSCWELHRRLIYDNPNNKVKMYDYKFFNPETDEEFFIKTVDIIKKKAYLRREKYTHNQIQNTLKEQITDAELEAIELLYENDRKKMRIPKRKRGQEYEGECERCEQYKRRKTQERENEIEAEVNNELQFKLSDISTGMSITKQMLILRNARKKSERLLNQKLLEVEEELHEMTNGPCFLNHGEEFDFGELDRFDSDDFAFSLNKNKL